MVDTVELQNALSPLGIVIDTENGTIQVTGADGVNPADDGYIVELIGGEGVAALEEDEGLGGNGGAVNLRGGEGNGAYVEGGLIMLAAGPNYSDLGYGGNVQIKGGFGEHQGGRVIIEAGGSSNIEGNIELRPRPAGYVIVTNLPTTDPALDTPAVNNALWNDNGVIKISSV